jgi:hypothetical protein
MSWPDELNKRTEICSIRGFERSNVLPQKIQPLASSLAADWQQ